MVTLKEVSRQAGVSVATASCCLSGAKNVRPATKARVMAAIEELGYIPNFSARSLKAAKRNEIGVVLTDIDDWYHAEILKGITVAVQRNDYNVSIAFSNNLSHLECGEIDRFIGRNLSGLIIITCQPDNVDFFQSRFTDHAIPVVFVEREPRGIDHNFMGFDNYRTIGHVVKQLLQKGYTRVALIRGPQSLSSEQDCQRGYEAAFEEYGLQPDDALLCSTNMSKEDAFKAAIPLFHFAKPQAVVCTSTGIAKGAMEAAGLLDIHIPQDLPVITLGEECWNRSNELPGVIHTARSAFSLGVTAAELLFKNIKSPRLFEKQRVIMQDNLQSEPLPLAEYRTPLTPHVHKKRPVLQMLVMDLPTTNALRLLADNYTQSCNVDVNFTCLTQDSLLNAIIADNNPGGGKYDIYIYDLPWTAYLVQNGMIEDISDFVEGSSFDKNSLLPENLAGCRQNGKYYGIPIVGGAQILFYRKDLFEDLSIRKAFENRYKIPLRPPVTWTEFNGVAEFFTRSLTPESPVAYGTSMAGINNQELSPELLIRLWACGGTLFDHNNRIRANSPACVKAMRIALKTLDYVEHDPFKTSIHQTVEDFCEGKTAMLITYSEYAAQISSVRSRIVGRVGYSPLPGRSPVRVGWNMGMSPHTTQTRHVFDFFRWICRKEIGYYLTIIDGQSASVHPYHNNELLKLYPWMSQALDSVQYSRLRSGPSRSNALIIPQSKLEDILCDAFHRISENGTDIEEALETARIEMKYLFKAYGY